MKNTIKSDASLDASLVWHEKGKRELLKTVVLTVTERDCVSFDGKEGQYVVMDAPDWVIVIPETSTGFLVVKQWRHGEKALSIEFPGGVAEKGEEPKEAAARELLEETGCTASSLIFLGKMNPNPALMSNHVHVFLAQGLERTSELSLDDDERLRAYFISREEVMRLAGKSECPHALMTAALALYLIHESEQSKQPPQANSCSPASAEAKEA